MWIFPSPARKVRLVARASPITSLISESSPRWRVPIGLKSLDVPLLRNGVHMKGCVRWEARRQVSILNLRLNRDRAFLHPIKENIKPALVDVNGLVAKTIVCHELTAAETGSDRCATHAINHKLAIWQFYPRNPRGLRDVNDVFHRAGSI